MTKQNRKMSKNLGAAFEKLAASKVRPNYYNGSGRWVTKSPDYAAQLVAWLQNLGMVAGRHFEAGNDAKFGGHTGEWVKLTALGRRRKVFQNIREEAEGVTV